MTNIQRQLATIEKLSKILDKGYNGSTNMQLTNVRRAHAAAMVKAGYTQAEATASAQECSDVARLAADAV